MHRRRNNALDQVFHAVAQPRAERAKGRPEHQEHEKRENRQRPYAVQHDRVDPLGDGQLVLFRALEAGAHNLFYVVIERICKHHFVIRGVGVAVHALSQCVQLFAHLARHIAAVFCPQFLITLEQLGRVKRQAAFPQWQRPQQVGRPADGRAHAMQISRLLRRRAHSVRQFIKQIMDVFALLRRDRHDWHTKAAFQLLYVDLHALCAYIVHKPKRHHHRQAERDEL